MLIYRQIKEAKQLKIETLRDILQWTQDYHQALSDCMKHCADQNESIRAKMLLDYLADHEKKLAMVLERFAQSADKKALNTWCVEYLDKHPIIVHTPICEGPFVKLMPGEIITQVTDQHNQIIDLYKHLLARAEIPTAKELLEQLTSLQEHQIMQMVHSANRLEDI